MVNPKDITQKSKSDKTMTEISNTLGTQALNQFQEISQEHQNLGNLQFQNQDHLAFLNQVECLVNTTREQQMSSDQQVQSTLNQASTNLIDSKRLANLYSDAKKLQQAAMLGISHLQMNMPQYQQTLEQMEQKCHQQQVATDMQVVQALQQAICAMATAQNSLLQSQAIDQVFTDINQCETNLKYIAKTNETPTTM